MPPRFPNKEPPMKVAVTGANGFVGLALCQHLKTQGVDFLPLTRDPQIIAEIMSDSLSESSDERACKTALSGCDTLVHLAALTHQPSTSPFANLDKFRQINVDFSRKLALAAAKAGVRRIVFMSSIKVYGDPANGWITQDTETTPNDAYGQTKLEAEHALSDICQETGMELVIIRPPLIFAPHAKGNLASLLRAVRSQLPLPLANVHNRRDLLSLPNLCDLIFKCLSHPNATGQPWLACDGTPISSADIIRTLAHTHQLKARLIPAPQSWLRWGAALMSRQQQLQKLTGDLQIDSRRTQDALEWQPQSIQALYMNPGR